MGIVAFIYYIYVMKIKKTLSKIVSYREENYQYLYWVWLWLLILSLLFQSVVLWVFTGYVFLDYLFNRLWVIVWKNIRIKNDINMRVDPQDNLPPTQPTDD